MRWTLPAGELVTGATGQCASSPGGTDVPAPVDMASCDPAAAGEMIAVHADGTVERGSYCLDVLGPDGLYNSSLDGAAVSRTFCAVQLDPGQVWLPGPGGELINNYSGKCLDDPGDGGSGTALVQEDCYGLAGEIWAVN
jgi:hypothetical protein